MRPTTEPLTLNALLRADGIDLREVLVFRHRPWEQRLNQNFDSIVARRRDLLDCYQSTHGPHTESALKRAKYVASFIRYRPKKALFIGLFGVDSCKPLSVFEYQDRPLHRELMALGMGGHKASDGREHVLEFSLPATGWREDWSERLIIEWPGLERSWYRWADRNTFNVHAIAEESRLISPMPPWDQLVLDWDQLRMLSDAWQAELSKWRGIYLIIDQSDGLQYVGSAYGRDNLLQRWQEYARTGHGGNKALRPRDPTNFRFSILQRTSPDLAPDDVTAIENSWKVRLRSRCPDGLNEN